MTLKDDFRTAARAAVGAVGDIAVSTTYLAFASASYDASAGSEVATFGTRTGVLVIFDEFRLVEVDGRAVRPEDKRALIPAANISGITPGLNDRILHDGQSWQVVNVRTDPAGVLWEFHIRRP